MPKSSLQLNSFEWHFGVVENRDDPLEMGRLQVRWFNVHSDDLSKQPTTALPWATPIFPVNNASTSGVGGPWTGAVEGSFVMGFFIDEGYQKPFIMGTIAGIPTDPPNPGLGFNDPFGTYPRSAQLGLNGLQESDVSRLSRAPETHDSLIQRRQLRETDIPIATAPSVKAVQDDKPAPVSYTREFWHEPHPALTSAEFDPAEDPDEEPAGFAEYPYNHVWETESGHVFEVDDTPEHERIHNYHRSGTFEEIKADGSKTVVIMGDGYEINVRDKNVVVQGTLNLTVYGDCKTLVKGDKYEEIDGNHFVTVRKDRITKIGGNEVTEILTDRNTQINGNNNIRITGNDITNITGNETISVGGTHTETIIGDTTITVISSKSESVLNKLTCVVGNSIDFGTAKNFSIAAGTTLTARAIGDMTIKTDANQTVTVLGSMTESITGTQSTTAEVSNINNDVNITGTSTATVDHVSAGISGATHTHAGSPTAPDGDVSDTGAPQ
jgi:hypothetical protein